MPPRAAALLPAGTAAFCQGARLLKENDPSTYTTVKGQTPGGFYAVSDMAEAGANGNSKGIRYNGGGERLCRLALVLHTVPQY